MRGHRPGRLPVGTQALQPMRCAPGQDRASAPSRPPQGGRMIQHRLRRPATGRPHRLPFNPRGSFSTPSSNSWIRYRCLPRDRSSTPWTASPDLGPAGVAPRARISRAARSPCPRRPCGRPRGWRSRGPAPAATGCPARPSASTVSPGSDHRAVAEVDVADHVRGAEVELRPVAGGERRVPAALRRRSATYTPRGEPPVRRDAARRGHDLAAPHLRRAGRRAAAAPRCRRPRPRSIGLPNVSRPVTTAATASGRARRPRPGRRRRPCRARPRR